MHHVRSPAQEHERHPNDIQHEAQCSRHDTLPDPQVVQLPPPNGGIDNVHPHVLLIGGISMHD